MMMTGHLQAFVLTLALAFVSSILKPDFDLGGREFQSVRQMFSLGSGEIALLLEASLQLENLRLGEKNPRLPPGSLSLRSVWV